MLQVTLYTKPGCHLCDDLLAPLHAMQADIDFQIVERNIEDNPDDFDRFQYLVPVLDVPGSGLLFPPHDMNNVRQTIGAASRTANKQP